MAAETAGSEENIEIGFIPSNTSVLTLAGTSAGYLDGPIEVDVVTELAFVKGALVNIAVEVVGKALSLAARGKEVLLENLQYAWNNDAPAGGVLTINNDVGTTFALTATTKAPNGDSDDTRVYSLPKAFGAGSNPHNMPIATAGQDNHQNQQLNFIGIGNAASSGLLGTLTDTYTP